MAEEYMTAYHFTKCDKGSREEYINLPVDHGVISMTTGYPLLNANDHRYEGENKNIRGYCSCKVIGQCRPLTPKVWESTAKKHLIEGAPALTENSKLKCMYGGTISFCDPPADVQKKMQEQEDAEKKAQELQEAQENSNSSYMGEDGMGVSMDSDTGEWEDNDRTGTGHADFVKESLKKMIGMGLAPKPEEMTGDYCVATVGANVFGNVSAGVGVIYDRKGNIYDLGEVSVGRGLSLGRVQISAGEGNVPVLKNNSSSEKYIDAISGVSVGIDQSNGLQVGISGTLPRGPESSEIKLSVPSIGVNGSLREVVCIGNLYEKTNYENVIPSDR
ncbi:protein of unknown function [Selenomonas ruminantium]|uniref:DUF4280 domain-containing protein n=1 Tax=Selenomonas ruminantium TaxID=971 RepID=A0A1I3E6L2_SELRU|nr:DUF4280 domain-containing protein [Selenomonas ruminantium]SFH94627.1 protein of unknown function [Selenomonas ruminantium]